MGDLILDTDEALYIGLSSFVLGTILFLHVTDATEATGRNNVRWKLGVNGIFLLLLSVQNAGSRHHSVPEPMLNIKETRNYD